MKAVQVLLDEPLLRRLDAHDDVRRLGRSAVLRLAAEEYLRRRRRAETAAAYRRAYAADAGIDPEFSGWTDEGTWPEV
jgi:metal-responsive CopG/Arc/MetJ family transcriptional regulator